MTIVSYIFDEVDHEKHAIDGRFERYITVDSLVRQMRD